MTGEAHRCAGAALITGASRRLGLYLTEALLRENWRVIALTRRASDALRALQDADPGDGGRLQIIAADYADLQAARAALKEVRAEKGGIDLLIHNASLFERDAAHETDRWDFYDALYAVHMRFPAFMNEQLRGCLSSPQRPGCIIHMTDIYAENPHRDFALYSSAKAGLENLAKSYAKKFAPDIRVNSILPGPLLFQPDHRTTERTSVSRRTLLPVEPGFLPILQGIKFIYENRFLTGSSIRIDGGRSIAGI